MKVWIVTIYEPLPFGDVKTRPQRCGMLAKTLLDGGHSVELWTSTFDHVSHKPYRNFSVSEKSGNNISIQFINGCGYPKDLSIKRLLHNRQTGREFLNLAGHRTELPDIIFAPVPILELAEAAVVFANERQIPIVVDVRDLWPDIYLTMVPKALHSIAKIILQSEYKRAKFIFKNATGITAVSKAYLTRGLSYAGRSLQDIDRVFYLGSRDIKPSNFKSIDSIAESTSKQGDCIENKFIATFVGTFSNFLDIQNILDAAKYLSTEKNIQIFIVGKGARGDEYCKMASQLPNVTMTGWLNSTDIQTIFQKTNVGLVAYAKDAMMSLPNKPFEYMAAGLPLLSSLNGELAELIKEHHVGRSYIAGNPISLAKEILWFYEHQEETRNMGERSYALFKSKFESDLIYKDLSEYLERIVQKYHGKQQ